MKQEQGFMKMYDHFIRNIKKLTLIGGTMLVTFNTSPAQQQDAIFWGSLNVEKKINRHFSLSLLNQYILNQNYAELGYYFLDGGVSYKFNDHIAASVNYRFTNALNRDNFYRQRQQWYADLLYTKGFRKFSATFRTRYQVQYFGLSWEDNYKRPTIYSRNKLTIRYRLNWYYSIFMSGEVFYNLRPLTVLDACRTFVGISRQFNLHHKLELSWGMQQQVNRKNKRKDYISGLAYYYKF